MLKASKLWDQMTRGYHHMWGKSERVQTYYNNKTRDDPIKSCIPALGIYCKESEDRQMICPIRLGNLQQKNLLEEGRHIKLQGVVGFTYWSIPW
eukprot:2644838-Ditylum_brightwellii.AAC.1